MHALQALSSAIPEELMCGAVPNPTVVALVAAIGEQLDLVDAAVHSLQACALPLFRFTYCVFPFSQQIRQHVVANSCPKHYDLQLSFDVSRISIT